MPRSIHHGKGVVPLAESVYERAIYAYEAGRLDEAEKLFRSAMALGEICAIDALATMLDDIPARRREAVTLYKRAVALGYATSAWNLAMHYIPLQQQRRYRHWMLKAAEMGCEDAIREAAKIAKNPDYMTRLPLEDDE
jgi:hypothetical protein